MEKYINDYKKAKKKPYALHNIKFCEFSTLQYFEDFIYSGIELSNQEVAPGKEPA